MGIEVMTLSSDATENEIFTGQSWMKKDYSNKTFKWCTFKDMNFYKTNFSGSDFTGCTFDNCAMSEADLSKATFTKGGIKNCSLSKVNLSMASLRHMIVYNCCFTESDLSSVRTFQSKFLDCDFGKSNMQNIRFGDGEISACSFKGADLRGADFSHWIELLGADFSLANLENADFRGATGDAFLSMKITDAKFGGTKIHALPLSGGKDLNLDLQDLLFQDYIKNAGLEHKDSNTITIVYSKSKKIYICIQGRVLCHTELDKGVVKDTNVLERIYDVISYFTLELGVDVKPKLKPLRG